MPSFSYDRLGGHFDRHRGSDGDHGAVDRFVGGEVVPNNDGIALLIKNKPRSGYALRGLRGKLKLPNLCRLVVGFFAVV